MAADIATGQNRATLQGIKDGVNGAPPALAQATAASGRMTKSGDGTTTVFTQTIALKAPWTKLDTFEARSVEAGKAHYLPIQAGDQTATQLKVTFVAAPAAGSNNIVFDYKVSV